MVIAFMKNFSRNMACHTTPRLDALIKILNNTDSVADIGSDHAYLPILLAKADTEKKIIASDIGTGPLSRAKNNVERFGLADRIELRLGDGLDTLCVGETQAIVIAGMGANVICNILSKGERVAKNAELLVLQPMTSAHELRRFLYENGYVINNEILVREDRRIYTIILAKSGDSAGFCDVDCYISDALLKSKDVLFDEYLKNQKKRLVRALGGMRRAKNKKVDINYYEKLIDALSRIEENF